MITAQHFIEKSLEDMLNSSFSIYILKNNIYSLILL